MSEKKLSKREVKKRFIELLEKSNFRMKYDKDWIETALKMYPRNLPMLTVFPWGNFMYRGKRILNDRQKKKIIKIVKNAENYLELGKEKWWRCYKFAFEKNKNQHLQNFGRRLFIISMYKLGLTDTVDRFAICDAGIALIQRFLEDLEELENE